MPQFVQIVLVEDRFGVLREQRVIKGVDGERVALVRLEEFRLSSMRKIS